MEKLKPVEAVALLKEQGIVITIEEAEQILEFVYAMAEAAVDQCLREEEARLKGTG